MLELTDTARKELESYFSDKEKATIRIFSTAGCGGPRLALALDEPAGTDHTEENNGLTFCIDKELLGQVQGVKINLTYMGFAVDPLVPFASTGESVCASCGSGCATQAGLLPNTRSRPV